MKIELFSALIACLFPVFIPIIHIYILWFIWSKYHFPVDKAACTCECWDSIFKGPYEKGIASYKNFYFNSTLNTLKIWIIICAGIILLYECWKYIITLTLRNKLRGFALILLLSSIFPHYYSWWVYINYLNDRFYEQWYHQFVFTATELISTVLVLKLANKQYSVTEFKLMIIIGISVIHVISGGIDQFFINLILRQGSNNQIVRDLGFILSDFLHVIIPTIELMKIRRESSKKHFYLDTFFMIKLIFITFLVFLGCLTAAYV